MKVIAVMPAYNSEKTLRKTWEAIPKDVVSEVILVNNDSKDKTREEAEKIPGLIVINHERNRGYGGSQKTCYSEALKRGADIVIMIHSDFQYDPTYVPQMIQPIIEDKFDMIMGSRFLKEDPRKAGMNWWRYLGNKFLSFLQRKMLGVSLSEFHSGYRAYNRKCLETVPFMTFSDDFLFDSQMVASVARKKLRLGEVAIPTSYHNDASSLSFWGGVKFGLSTLRTLFP